MSEFSAFSRSKAALFFWFCDFATYIWPGNPAKFSSSQNWKKFKFYFFFILKTILIQLISILLPSLSRVCFSAKSVIISVIQNVCSIFSVRPGVPHRTDRIIKQHPPKKVRKLIFNNLGHHQISFNWDQKWYLTTIIRVFLNSQYQTPFSI